MVVALLALGAALADADGEAVLALSLGEGKTGDALADALADGVAPLDPPQAAATATTSPRAAVLAKRDRPGIPNSL